MHESKVHFEPVPRVQNGCSSAKLLQRLAMLELRYKRLWKDCRKSEEKFSAACFHDITADAHVRNFSADLFRAHEDFAGPLHLNPLFDHYLLVTRSYSVPHHPCSKTSGSRSGGRVFAIE